MRFNHLRRREFISLLGGTVAWPLVAWAQRRLAHAPPTEERITRPELRKAMTNAMSLRKSLLLAVTWAFTCVTQIWILLTRNWYHPLFSDVQSYLNTFTAVFAAALALYYLAVTVRKIESRALASQRTF